MNYNEIQAQLQHHDKQQQRYRQLHHTATPQHTPMAKAMIMPTPQATPQMKTLPNDAYYTPVTGYGKLSSVTPSLSNQFRGNTRYEPHQLQQSRSTSQLPYQQQRSASPSHHPYTPAASRPSQQLPGSASYKMQPGQGGYRSQPSSMSQLHGTTQMNYPTPAQHYSRTSNNQPTRSTSRSHQPSYGSLPRNISTRQQKQQQHNAMISGPAQV